MYKASDFCDASKNSCEVVVGVNWKANTYTIGYTLNGGTKGSSAPTTGTYDSALKINNPSKTVTVTGNVNGTGATIGSAVSKAQTFAGWTSSSSDGLNTSTAKIGTTTSPSTSWSGSATKNLYYKNLRVVSGTVTLSAKWTPVALKLPTVTKTGYVCSWNTKADGSGTSYASGANYTPSATSSSAITVYAICKANTYTVKYSCGTGTGTPPTTQTATYDNTFTVAANTCSKTGYSFTGWNDPTGVSWTGWSGTWKYVNGQYGISDNSLTLTAQWKIDTYSITYDANGGSGAPSAGTKTHGTNYTLSSTKPTRTGYSFVNWNTKKDGSGTSYNAGATYKTNAALKLYAQWKADTYSIMYDANGGSGAPSAGTKTHDTNYTLSSTKPTRTGYSFVNWNTKKDGSGTSYNAGATYKTNAALKLYAQWKDGTAPTITLGTDGTTKWKKSVSSTITVTDNGSGVNTSTLKYIFSTSNTANPTTTFTNGGTVSLKDVSDKYYLRVYACDNAGNCTTKTSKVFKLDNIAPTVTCDNTKAYLMQKLNSDGSENTLSISKTETCTVYAQMITASGGLYSSRWDTLIESDNNSVYDWEYSSKMINEDGSVVDNFQKTKGNCNNGYCSWVFTMEVWDQAGNSASGSFTYKVKY